MNHHMGTDHDIHAVDIDLDRVLWDAEYRRRVIDSLKRREETPISDVPPHNRKRAPPPPSKDRGTDPAKRQSARPNWTG